MKKILMVAMSLIIACGATYAQDAKEIMKERRTIQKLAKSELNEKATKDARKEAESMKRTKMLETKEKCIQMKSEMEQQINARYSKLQSAESKAQQRESQLNQQQQELQRKKNEVDSQKANLDSQLEKVEKKKNEVEKILFSSRYDVYCINFVCSNTKWNSKCPPNTSNI